MVRSKIPEHTLREETLERSEARFRTVFEQSPVSTQIFSPDGITLAVNRAWERLWGVTVDQIEGYNILQDQQLVDKGIMPYIQKGFAGEPTTIPPICYVPGETIPDISAVAYRWVAASIYPVKDEHGAIREVVLMHEDITERKQAEEALRESEERYRRSEERFRTIFDGAPVGISVVDEGGRYIAVNPMRQQMLGYSEEELLGRPYWELTFPEDVDYDLRINAAAREHHQDRFQLEKRFVHKDGSIRWTRITVSLVRDDRGEPRYSISVAEDITARKEAEEAVAKLYELERKAREKGERLAAERAAILGQLAEGIVIADPAGRISFINEVARRILGVDRLGVPLEFHSDAYHLLTLDGRPYPPEELPLSRAVLGGETVVDAQWRIRRPDGTDVVAQGSATPVVSEDGTRLGAVLTVRDVTAQYDLQRQKDDFLSAAAHDLRTPLTSIKGRVQLLRRRVDLDSVDPEKVQDELTRIDTNVTRMVTLLNELLDVANIQIGRPLSLVPAPTDLVTLAQSVAAEHQQADDLHHIAVESAVPDLVGSWDAARLERVLANLLSNAIKYSPSGADIVLEIWREQDKAGSWAVLAVKDQGIGIPAGDLPYVFERFHRAQNVAGKIPGTGIGLAAVRAIVEQHGGTVSVESREGVGTTFTVRLPLA